MKDYLLRDLTGHVGSGRHLDHVRPLEAPQNGPVGNKAAVTADGYCIEYKETLEEHF